MQKNKSISILVCYYGAFPWYFSYFLHSCKYNPDVTFYVITDNPISECRKPVNVVFIIKTLQEIKEIAQDKFGFEVTLESPYKLCDFKPAYGHLFSELIADCRFWGYSDIDVIFGNIRTFITDDILNKYELISVRHDFLTGYFQLFKNNKKMNTLFTNSKDYKKVFSSTKNYCFDETNYQFEAFAEQTPFDQIKSEIESMMHVVRKMEEANCLKAYFDFHVIEGRPGKLKWDNGVLTYKNIYEVILYHLIKLKAVYNPKNQPKKLPDVFYISPTRIYS
jgi:hypothetical protein